MGSTYVSEYTMTYDGYFAFILKKGDADFAASSVNLDDIIEISTDTVRHRISNIETILKPIEEIAYDS